VMGVFMKQRVGRTQSKPKRWHPGRTERRIQELARRRATRQLLRVPENRFSQVQQEYLGWEAFTLWVRAVVGTEGRLPSWMIPVLQEHCPGFLEHARRCQSIRPKKSFHLPHLLLEWIHDHVFAWVKQEGWLDALIFYSVRDAYSQSTWAHCEQCEDEWSRIRPTRYPSFDEWRLAADRAPLAVVPGGKRLNNRPPTPTSRPHKR